MHACLSLPAGTEIIPPVPCSSTTVALDGETLTSRSCTARAQPATSESTKAAPIDPADWPALSDKVRKELVSGGPYELKEKMEEVATTHLL